LSQHFFRDPLVAQRLVVALPIMTRTVLEIGPGTGILTEALADRGFRVIAIEKDARLFRALRERLIGRTNVECHHADFLDTLFPTDDFTIVANLPFNITGATIQRVTSAPRPPRDAFLVVQLEAACKFAGTPRESLASLLLRPMFETSILRLFRRFDFDPVPRVRPALLRVHRRTEPLLPAASTERYRAFVADMFGSSAPAGVTLRAYFTRRQILRLARDHNFSTTARVSELAFPQWLALFRLYEHACMGRDPTARQRLPAYAPPTYNALRVYAALR
jgi:23S rRNA (adenine-N6)-dimethyltransferase